MAGSRVCTAFSRPGAYGVEHRYSTVACSVSAMKAWPSPSVRKTARPLVSSSRVASQVPNPGDPSLISTTTSMTAPATQVTYLAWPGGTSE